MKLRPYQQHALNAICQAWKTVQRTLLVLPTGCGKTIVFAHLTAKLVDEGGRVLVLAHRGELLDQAADKIGRSTGLSCAVEKAENESHDAFERVTVGSVQTLMRQSRLDRFKPDHYSHIVVDEAHHALADSYQAIFRHFTAAKVLGVTATPDRNDRKNLGAFFESLAYEYSLLNAIREGYLVPIRALSIPLQIDLSGVSIQQGDFAAKDVDDALAPYLGRIAHEMGEHCRDRKTLVFTPLVATAQKFSAMLKAQGFDADWVSGDDPDRVAKLARYSESGRGAVLVNSMLLTEGYDDPATDCVVCLRPTKSRPLYAQIIGRGTRLAEGKADLLLLDFLWMTDKHELCRPAHLVCETSEEAAAMTKATEAAGAEGMELDDNAIKEAQREVIAEREKKLADELARQRGRQRKLVDPLQYLMSVNAADLADYQPAFGWEAGPASDKQKQLLEKAGIFPEAVANAGMATKLLDRLAARRAAGFATPKQIRLLERYQFKHVGEMPTTEATKIIGRLAANSWRMTADLSRAAAEWNAVAGARK